MEGSMRKNHLFVQLFVFTAALVTQNAFAGGFELQEQSVRGLGQAFAGKSTGFGDGSEVYFNPAAMGQIEEGASSVGLNYVFPNAHFKDSGSSLVPSLGGAPLTGSEGGNGGVTAPIPNMYYVHKVNERTTAGFGLNSPFGLKSKYDSDWIGRYHAIKSELTVVNMVPSVSVKMLDGFTVGAGLNILHLSADISNAVDFGTIGATTLGAANAAALGLTPQGADGFARVQGTDWATGINLGSLINITDRTKLGLAYRGKIESHLNGGAQFAVPSSASVLTSTGSFMNGPAHADVTLPENFSAGLTFDVNERTSYSLEGTWTRWSRFNELRVIYDSAQPDSVTEEDWGNTWRVAGGFSHKYSPCLTVRAGFAWEETPVQSAGFRTPRIPDNDRIWSTLGWSWQATDSMTLDVAYAHISMLNGNSNNVNATGAALLGKYDTSVDIISAGLTWSLG